MKDKSQFPVKEWATTGNGSDDNRKIINSLYIKADSLEEMNLKLEAVYNQLKQDEVMVEEYLCEDAEIIITAYGTVGRIAKSAVSILREKGIKAGLIRPITLFPFPTETYEKYTKIGNVKSILDVELSVSGQMIEDVKLSVNGAVPVSYYGRSGGNVMTDEDIVNVVMNGRKA